MNVLLVIMNYNINFRFFWVFFLLFFCCTQKEKDKSFVEGFETLILKNSKVNENIEMKLNSSKDKIKEYSYTFLGTLEVRRKKYLLLYKTILSGYKSPQLNNYLIFYDTEYNKIGYYYMQGIDMPVLKGNVLIFSNMSSDCKQIQTIDFTDEIPEQIFIPCNNDEGDYINLIK